MTQIAKDVAVPASAVQGVLPECNTLVSSCLQLIPAALKRRIFDLDCLGVSLKRIAYFFDFAEDVIKQVLKMFKGKVCLLRVLRK